MVQIKRLVWDKQKVEKDIFADILFDWVLSDFSRIVAEKKTIFKKSNV